MTEHQTVEYKQVWKDDERIMQACAKAGVPTPEVSCDVNGLWMSFHFLPEHQVDSGHEVAGETTQETTQEKIIKQIKLNPAITQKGLSEQTGISVDGVKYHLKKLKDAGIIKRSGSTKAGHWEVLE
jgi:ATP-dependent DNA helicase RecG